MYDNEISLRARSLNDILAEDPRPFGSDLAGQDKIYLIYLPLGLMLAGLMIWMFPSDESFVLGSAIGGLIGLYAMLDLLFRDSPIRLSAILGMSLLFGYNLGALNSWLTIPRGGLTIADYFARDPQALARATGAILCACAVLFFLGQMYERPVFGREFRIDFKPRSVVLVVVSTALLLFGFFTGRLGFMGVTVSVTGRISPYAALVIWWSGPAFAYSVCTFFNTVGRSRLLVALCTLMQFVLLVPLGRRTLGYTILLALIAMRLGRFRSQLGLIQKVAIGITAAAVIFVSSIAFLYLRVAAYGHKEQVSLGSRLNLAVDSLRTRTVGEMIRLLGQNASTRSFDLGYFSDLLDASQHSAPLLGADLGESLQLMVPSAISADKFGLTVYQEEQLVDMHWGFGFTDEGNSILTAGAADFGVLGIFLYPIAIVFVMRWGLELFQTVMPTFVSVLVALGFIAEMLQTEDTLTGYFTQIRNTLIFAVLYYLLSQLPRFRLQRAAPNELLK